jgi:hypothetical protein
MYNNVFRILIIDLNSMYCVPQDVKYEEHVLKYNVFKIVQTTYRYGTYRNIAIGVRPIFYISAGVPEWGGGCTDCQNRRNTPTSGSLCVLKR